MKFLLKYCSLYEIEIIKILLVYSSFLTATLISYILSLNKENQNQTRMERDVNGAEKFFFSALLS
jgi:hypothetical protein